jgi:tetratricopeptide (TPR) repeat protein
MRLATHAALALLCAGLPAAAQTGTPTQQSASTHLAAAQRLYQKLDLEAALAELKEAEVAAKDNEDETATIFIYRGLIYAETGKTADAQDMFKRALAIRPWAEVPPDTSPRLAKVFGDARKSLWGTAANVKPPQKKQRVAAPPAVAPAPEQTPPQPK